MAGTVIDELVVQLRLDSEQYSKVEATVERQVAGTERNMQERARRQDRRDKDQQRRLKDTAQQVRQFTTLVAAGATAVGGLGVALGASFVNLLGFNTEMRRQAVGTSLSNRQMQAWSATARRLGADANAGREAVAALAREQQQGWLTGNAPTIQALQRMGVNASPDRAIEDILTDAQRAYRAAPAGQQQQFENTLAAQGVSSDLILLIKSEIDVREAYSRSFAQSSEENRKALDDLADSLESMKSQAIAVTSSLLSAFMPAIEKGAEWLGWLATEVASFANDVTLAGGGVRAFQQELEKRIPAVGTAITETQNQAERFSDSIALTSAALDWLTEKVGGWARRFGDGFDNALRNVRTPWRTDGTSLYDTVSGWRNSLRSGLGMTGGGARGLDGVLGRANDRAVDWARTRNERRTGAWSSIKPLDESGGGAGGGATTPVTGDAMGIMQHLVTQYGNTPAQAAAIVANWQRESGLKGNAFNAAGGGTGARGLAQWRGARTQAFEARYGVKPDQAPIAQQIEFAMTDPYERQLMLRSFGSGGDANSMGVGYSRYYEAHGNAIEDARRGRDAAALERRYGAGDGAAGDTFNIQNLNVSADNPQQMVGGLQRLSGSQNHNSVQR